MDDEERANLSAGSQLPRRFQIGDWQIDQLQGVIQRGEEIARLRPLAMRFLVHLAAHAPEPISTNDLVKQVWSPRIVGDDSVYVAVRELRKKLGDDARHPQYIETIPKRGVRMVAEVRIAATVDRSAVESVIRFNDSAHSRLPAFVGREDVLTNLVSCLDSALTSRGRVVFIAGEPGIGKTRTAQEFAERAEARGALVYSGWCDSSLVSPPGWPWVRLLRAMLHAAPPGFLQERLARDARAMLSTILPELRTSEPDLPEAPDVSSERLMFELAQAVSTLLNNIAEPHGLIVILDDVHRADEQSLTMLGVLAREISQSKVVLVGTYRDTEVGGANPFAGILADLSRLPHYERVTLAGLSRADVATLLSQSSDSATDRLDAIMVKTDGNSLFVTEIIRAVAMHRNSADEAELLPRSLREVILGRLRQLSVDCRSAVDVASVIGEEFVPETVESVGRIDADTVDRMIDEALKSGVFVPAPAGVVRFAHALIRDAIYGDLPRRRRIDLHHAIAQTLAASFDPRHETSSHPEAVAHHFQEAGMVAKAIDYWEQAANVALQRSVHSEQIRRLQQALHLLSTSQSSAGGDPSKSDRQREIDEREIQFRLALGNAHTLVDSNSSSAGASEFARVLELCNRYSDAPELERSRFMALNGLWGYHNMRLDTDETRQLVTLQSELAERADSEAFRLQASSADAITRFYEGGDFSRSLEALDVATQRYTSALTRRIARGATGPWRTSALISPGLYSLCLALVGRADEALKLGTRSLDEARHFGAHAHIQALTYLEAVYETTRDFVRARDISQQVVELSDEFGYSSWMGAIGHCVHGWARCCLSEPEAGLAEVRKGYDTYRATGTVLSFSYRACFLAETMLRGGHIDEAARLIDDTLGAGRERMEHFFDAELMRTRGECDLAQKDGKGSVVWFRRARDLAVAQRSPLFELRATAALVRSNPSDKRLMARLKDLTRELATGIGQSDLDDATRAQTSR